VAIGRGRGRVPQDYADGPGRCLGCGVERREVSHDCSANYVSVSAVLDLPARELVMSLPNVGWDNGVCFEGDEFLLIAEHASPPAIASAAANAREIASHERTIAEAQKRLGEAAQNISAIRSSSKREDNPRRVLNAPEAGTVPARAP
jgi:hypothetical protein